VKEMERKNMKVCRSVYLFIYFFFNWQAIHFSIHHASWKTKVYCLRQAAKESQRIENGAKRSLAKVKI